MKLSKESNSDVLKILISAKPIIFKKKKLTRVGDLVSKNKTFGKGSDEKSNKDSNDDEDLSEEFFDKYFSQMNKREVLNIEKTNNSNVITQNNSNSNINSAVQNETKPTHGFIPSADLIPPKKQKKKIEYESFASSLVITQCQIDTVKDIHTDISLLLQEIPKSLPEIKITKLEYLQLLDLSYNKLKCIHNDISLIPNLKILKLNNNLLSDLNKIVSVGNIKNLTSLNMANNAICRIRGYRQYVIEMCPVLEQLDNAQVTEKELEVIHFGGSRFGEKRENGHGKVIKYPKK